MVSISENRGSVAFCTLMKVPPKKLVRRSGVKICVDSLGLGGPRTTVLRNTDKK
jgi:hypothetical protein